MLFLPTYHNSVHQQPSATTTRHQTSPILLLPDCGLAREYLMFTRHYDLLHPGVAVLAFIESPWYVWTPDAARVYMYNLLVHGRPTPPRIASCSLCPPEHSPTLQSHDLANYGRCILWRFPVGSFTPGYSSDSDCSETLE
eukprot:2230709-Alexandrium_andersonii.AAC.1